jgi:four helix bundle protein
MRDYLQLPVWQRAHALTLGLYRATQRFPKSEIYGLTDQLRCAAIKMVSRIAQGAEAETETEQKRFFRAARGSSFAVDALLLLSRDLGYLKLGDWVILDSDCRELAQMLRELIRSLQG